MFDQEKDREGRAQAARDIAKIMHDVNEFHLDYVDDAICECQEPEACARCCISHLKWVVHRLSEMTLEKKRWNGGFLE